MTAIVIFFGDLRHAARRLAAAPGFAAAATLTIALGVGLNAGVFSILNGVFFSDLPVPAAERLVDMYATVYGVDGRNEKGRINPRFTTTEYRLLRDRSETLSGLLGYSVLWPVVLGGDEPRQIMGRYVTCSFFDVLRQPPALGRNLAADDCETGAPPVVMLSHAFWSARFASDRDVVGRTVELNGRSFTVAGIAAADALQPDLQKLDFFAPISAQPILRPDREWLVSEDFGWLTLVGRQRDGATLEAVRAELGVIVRELDRRYPGRETTLHVDRARATTNRPVTGIGVSTAVAAALAPFGLLLLVACANVANLFLARSGARAGEVALRRSLGASRARIVQLLLAESLLVAMAGGALGTLLAVVATEGLVATLLSPLPVVLPALSVDARVLAFALALSFAAGLAAGLVPALRCSRSELGTTIKDGSTQGRGARLRLQDVLIGVQVTVCIVLLVGAGLLLRGLYNASTVDPGFPYRQVAVVVGDLRDLGYTGDALAAFQTRLAAEVEALPGVEAAGYSASPPWHDRMQMRVVRLPEDGADQAMRVELDNVTPGYFDAIGIPIVRGRAFGANELAESSTAVVVTETTAARLWPGQDPLGRALVARIAGGESTWQVVGVAKDAQVRRIGEVDTSYVYRPPEGAFMHMLSLVVRGRGDYTSVAPEITELLERMDLALTVVPLEANLAALLDQSALLSGIAATLGALALALAAVGIFGMVSYVVGRRLREIGIRLALGARSTDVLAAILRGTFKPVAAGAVAGTLLAVAGAGVLSSVLFGVSRLDPVGIGGAVALVIGIAFLASVVPARRGLGADPIATLRSE